MILDRADRDGISRHGRGYMYIKLQPWFTNLANKSSCIRLSFFVMCLHGTDSNYPSRLNIKCGAKMYCTERRHLKSSFPLSVNGPSFNPPFQISDERINTRIISFFLPKYLHK